MFSKATIFLATTFAIMASASPIAERDITGSCNSGSAYCCNSVQSASSGLQKTIGGLAGLALGPITGQIGLTCNPISAIGIGGNSCSSQPTCCEHNTFNGVIALGCNPINVNL